MPLFSRRRFLESTIAGSATWKQLSFLAPQSPSAAPGSRIRQSVSRWCYPKMTLDELCRASAKTGLVGIDLLQAEEYSVPAQYGLICTMGYAGGGEIKKGLNRIENHAEIEAGLRKYIPLAAKAGVPNVITFSGLRDGLSDEEGARNTIVGLRRIKSIAEDHGVTICMELLNSKVDHKGYMCDHTEWGAHVVQQVDSVKIKLLYDIYHMQIMEGDLVSTIRKYGQWIGHFHTGGVPGRHNLDDTQEVNWAGVVSGIRATGYSGYVAHEFIPTGDPLTALQQAYKTCAV